MRLTFYIFTTYFFIPLFTLANGDTTTIPLNRQVFHDKIIAQQKRADKADGRIDGLIKVSTNPEINLQVTDAIFRKINVLRNDIEINAQLATNNDKIRYLRYVEYLVRDFTNNWRSHKIEPALAPLLVDNFADIMYANLRGESMATLIQNVPYEVGLINSQIFDENPGYKESQKILFLKFCKLYPDKILAYIGPYVNEPFADSLVIAAFINNPSQLYSYAQAVGSPQGRLIRRNNDVRVKTIVALSNVQRALFYFPFLDDLIKGRQTIETIAKYAGSSDKTYDSVGYFKLLVRTEENYYPRLVAGDTPVAMIGSDGLIDMLKRKAVQHFIKPINDLHESPNPAVRFRAIEPLSAEDLYYMMVFGENDIYTSSYKYAFDRMMQKMGPVPHGDSLLMTLNFDHFKKFIKMAAEYNKLDVFLKSMPAGESETLMQAFVSNLEKTGSLEDAVDVADAYGSIANPVLQKSMLNNVEANEQRCLKDNNEHGSKIYNLLRIIFLSSDEKNGIDLSKEIGIPPVFTVNYNYLADDSGRIIEQVFFYGDKDGKQSYNSYLTSFPRSDWQITQKKEWIEIKSIKGKPIWIFANLPLDNETDKDADAQKDLINYLEAIGLKPSIVIHRGHSYHLPYTIQQLSENAKIIMLGSCGGYQNLKTILKFAPEAHIISTKQTGAMDVNKPIIDALDNTLRNGENIDWRQMWAGLTNYFNKTSRETRETFEDYIPPQKNLGALLIKAYSRGGEVVQ
ncbi:hypothetical protein FW778_06470 [Ginsengibacter hankyongi]|uniref:Uncharacterized protein n=1 Tax=Ginsengibacter hankyongi TaxID=2607284 RepID=A0A5J5IQ42_9BACT|nr:hypothetical protein [Ginsengibacter hankyongi]KAA9041662.1 hypothetical protein FW778_06470 [Ginsengibacter hankyongi]